MTEEKQLTLEDLKKEQETFLANEDNKKRAFTLAVQMEEILGKKWSTLDRIALKTGNTKEECFQKIKLLELFGYAFVDKGDGEKTRERGQWVFKVAVAKEEKIKAIDKMIESYYEEIDKLKLKIKVLQSEL